MIQSNLFPTTNTLSRLADTLSSVSDASTTHDVVNTVVEQVSGGSSSRQIGLTIAIIGLLIFTAHLFSEIFSRKRIQTCYFSSSSVCLSDLYFIGFLLKAWATLVAYSQALH